jgi:ubiquinone/menaquinone biosynthesis C-methylase UbiE/uncharacterized protein YbaR (Trm112 family)
MIKRDDASILLRLSIMHRRLVDSLACPICGKSFVFKGQESVDRIINGHLRCGGGHLYQIKQEIGLLKDAKLSANEFEWKIDVADVEKYDQIRKQYDSYLREDQKLANQRMRERLVDLVVASSRADNKVLDIATGMGTFILPLAEHAPQRAMIVGTDIDEKPLRGAMTRAKKAEIWQKLSLLVTDAKHLAFKSQTFSTISSYFGFDNVPQAATALKEASRVLHTDGKIFLSSLWLEEESESMRIAEQHRIGQIASEKRLKDVLDAADLMIIKTENIHSGVWPHNPMDLLPVEGDKYTHVIAELKKKI